MTDALFEMKDARRDGTPIIVFRGRNAWISQWCEKTWCTREGWSGGTRPMYRDDELDGWLPFGWPATSAAVSQTAGEWLSRCTAEDVAKVIRERLADEDVREAVAEAASGNELTRVSMKTEMARIAQEGRGDG